MKRLGVSGAVIGGAYVPGDVSLSHGVIDQVGLPPGRGGLAIPGFVDLQVNGFAGIDFAHATEEEWQEANRRLLHTGVTAYLANLISNDPAVTTRALGVAGSVLASDVSGGAQLAGVHLEGPFLSEQRAGIHPRSHLATPQWELMERWIRTGVVAMATLAPELAGATDMVTRLRKNNVVVSLGHSQSTYAQAIEAFDAGATTVTHLFNAMSGITAREPGLSGAALSRSDVWLQLIVDLLHVDPVLIELIISHAPDRVVLVTDCLPVSGTEAVQLSFGGSEITVVDGMAANSEGVLAGSVLQMDQALRNAVSRGMSVLEAVNAASLNPLSVLRRPVDALLAPGSVADVLVVSDSLELDEVFLAGVDSRIQEVR
jgi:N-acetylglucosamine-6-phosphate deacetylase